MRKLIIPVLALAAWWIWACDSGNPVAPSPPDTSPAPAGVTFTLGLSISPSQLTAGSGVPGTVTVTATRDDNGEAPDNGTLVTLSTDKGDFGGDNGDVVTLGLSDGSATASLFPADSPETATLLAQLSGSSTTLSVEFVEATPATLFINAVEPRSGSADGGTRVLVLGGGFAAPLTVSFGGGQGSVVSVTSSTITVDTPAASQSVAAGETLTVDVTVNNALDSADTASTTLAGGFVYAGEGVTPVFITGIDPDSGPADEETAVTISGGGFQSPAQVDFGGRPGTGLSVSSDGTEITVTAPPSAQAVPDGETLSVDVTVTSGLDQDSPQTATLTGGFTYQGEATEPAIVVSAIDPAQGSFEGGTLVTVTGQNFTDPVSVELAGVRQRGPRGTTPEVFVSSTMVRFTTAGAAVDSCPAGGQLAQTGVTVTNLTSGVSGTASLTFNYTVPAPRIDRVAPTFGSQAGNTTVTLQGADFVEPVRVVFTAGGQEFAAVVRSVAEDQVVVTSPSVPNSVFPETDCTTPEGEAGKVYGQVTADVKAINLDTGCEDNFGNIFTYDPLDQSCRQVSG